MRKYIIGFIAGILVATAGVAAADTVSLIGKKIQSEAIVTLDGSQIDTAIIVDGKSYAPVRSVAEAVGVGVGYEKGVVKLETQSEEPKTLKYWESRLESLNWSLENYKKLVVNAESSVQSSLEGREKWQSKLDNLADDASEQKRAEYQALLDDNIANHGALEAELKERQARVAEIEAEIELVKGEIAKLQAQ